MTLAKTTLALAVFIDTFASRQCQRYLPLFQKWSCVLRGEIYAMHVKTGKGYYE